jgi:hypothetical protein
MKRHSTAKPGTLSDHEYRSFEEYLQAMFPDRWLQEQEYDVLKRVLGSADASLSLPLAGEDRN